MQPTNTCALLLRSTTGRVAYVTGPAVTRYYARAARMGLQLAVLHGSISAPMGLPQFVQQAVYNTGMWAHA